MKFAPDLAIGDRILWAPSKKDGVAEVTGVEVLDQHTRVSLRFGSSSDEGTFTNSVPVNMAPES